MPGFKKTEKKEVVESTEEEVVVVTEEVVESTDNVDKSPEEVISDRGVRTGKRTGRYNEKK